MDVEQAIRRLAVTLCVYGGTPFEVPPLHPAEWLDDEAAKCELHHPCEWVMWLSVARYYAHELGLAR